MNRKKIVHIDFSGPWTENMTYQENLLPDAMAVDGNEVFLLVPCYEWRDGKISKTRVEEKRLDSGVELRRYEFSSFGCRGDFLARKLRYVPKFDNVLEELNPDIIMLHCPQTLVGISVCKYIKKHKDKCLVVDTHSDYFNSATNFVSKYFLHRVLYKYIARKLEKYTKYIYYLTSETKRFYMTEYGVKGNKLKYLPLGGKLLPELEYVKYRQEIRTKLGMGDGEVLFLHSGKIDKKKKTDQLVNAFYRAENRNGRLVILGTCDEDMQPVMTDLLSRNNSKGRVEYLGWQSGDVLLKYLCAADVYCQPGSQSATFQNAICCKCAVISYPHEAYKECYVEGNGMWAKDEDEIVDAINFVLSHPKELQDMRDCSAKIAREKLDYASQGRMILVDCLEEDTSS